MTDWTAKGARAELVRLGVDPRDVPRVMARARRKGRASYPGVFVTYTPGTSRLGGTYTAARAWLSTSELIPPPAVPEPAERLSSPGEVQVIVPPALRFTLDAWLESRGLELFPVPSAPDDLPTYGIRGAA